jgi:hypothetical protein
VLALPEEVVASSLVLGAAVHSALQFHFEQLLASNSAPGLDTLLDVFWDAWRGRDGQEILFNKGEDINSIGKLVDRMLRAFQRSCFSRPEGQIIAVEEELQGELIPGLPVLQARVDLVIETGTDIEVWDFKTCRSTWNEERVAESAGQLLLYSEVVKDLSDGKPLRLGFAVLTKSKTPDLMLHPVTADSHQMQRNKRIVEQIWRAIESGSFYPRPSPLNCPTCPYREPCREWRG